MNIKILAEKYDKIKNFFLNKYIQFTTAKDIEIGDFLRSFLTYILIFISFIFIICVKMENTELLITIMCLIALFMFSNKIIDIVYIYIAYLKEKEEIKNIDLDLIGSTSSNILENGEIIHKSISQALDDHIEDILNSNILFFMKIPTNEYIRSDTEQEILNSLIENVMQFTSKSLKKKLSLYYGSENIDLLIGRRCLIIVSLYVANHNKNIYMSTPNMN